MDHGLEIRGRKNAEKGREIPIDNAEKPSPLVVTSILTSFLSWAGFL